MTLVTMSVGKGQSRRIWGVQILLLTGRGGMHVAVSLFGCFPFSVVTILAKATWEKGGSLWLTVAGCGMSWWERMVAGVGGDRPEWRTSPRAQSVLHWVSWAIPVSVQIRIIAMSWFWAWLYFLLHGTKYSNSHRVIQFGSFIEVAHLLLGKTKAL